jgi:hypothetical protein
VSCSMNDNNNNTRLKISSSDFLRKDNGAGLVRLLKNIQEAGKDGIYKKVM